MGAPPDAREPARLEADFDIYGERGFRDSVNVDTGVVSSSYLSLDQGMIMAAIGNALADDVLRRAVATRATERALRPVVGVEEFAAEPRGCTIAGGPGADRLLGTARDDVICAGAGDDRIAARGGDDAVFGDAGDDVVRGRRRRGHALRRRGRRSAGGRRRGRRALGWARRRSPPGRPRRRPPRGGAGTNACLDATGSGDTSSGC